MSRSAKIFFVVSVALSGGTIWGVHYIQQQERITMFQGVLRDDARLAAKRVQKAREVEFEEQARKRAYLENMQGVSTGSSPKYEGEIPKTAEGMNFGCTDCENIEKLV